MIIVTEKFVVFEQSPTVHNWAKLRLECVFCALNIHPNDFTMHLPPAVNDMEPNLRFTWDFYTDSPDGVRHYYGGFIPLTKDEYQAMEPSGEKKDLFFQMVAGALLESRGHSLEQKLDRKFSEIKSIMQEIRDL